MARAKKAAARTAARAKAKNAPRRSARKLELPAFAERIEHQSGISWREESATVSIVKHENDTLRYGSFRLRFPQHGGGFSTATGKWDTPSVHVTARLAHDLKRGDGTERAAAYYPVKLKFRASPNDLRALHHALGLAIARAERPSSNRVIEIERKEPRTPKAPAKGAAKLTLPAVRVATRAIPSIRAVVGDRLVVTENDGTVTAAIVHDVDSARIDALLASPALQVVRT